MAPARRRGLLGRAIAFIPQAPMTALNPVLTIGAQFDEHLARLGATQPRRSGASTRWPCCTPRDCRRPKICSDNIRTNCPAACASAC